MLTCDPRISLDALTHRYTVRGYEDIYFRSVTEVARTCVPELDKDFIVSCMRKHHPDKTHAELREELEQKIDKSLETGRKFHAYIDSIHNFSSMSIPSEPEVAVMHKQWHAWMTGSDRKKGSQEKVLIATECRLFDPKMAIAGTIDALVRVGPELWLVDWKTNRTISKDTLKEYEIQLQLYDFILRCCYCLKVDRLVLLNVHPTRARARQIEVKRTRTDQDLIDICGGKGDATSEEDRVMAMYDI